MCETSEGNGLWAVPRSLVRIRRLAFGGLEQREFGNQRRNSVKAQLGRFCFLPCNIFIFNLIILMHHGLGVISLIPLPCEYV